MILSLLYKADARDVRLLLIDPKMLEMSVYEGIPHLLAPVVTDMPPVWVSTRAVRRAELLQLLKDLGAKIEAGGHKLPSIYCVNWFRKDEAGKFVWPGYGDNMRVLKWMIDRLEGQAQGQETMFGVTPTYGELNWTGLNFTADQFKTVTSIDKAAWQQELQLHNTHFEQLAYNMPKALLDTKAALEQRLAAI